MELFFYKRSNFQDVIFSPTPVFNVYHPNWNVGLKCHINLVILFAPCLFIQRCFKTNFKERCNIMVVMMVHLEGSGGREQEEEKRNGRKMKFKVGLSLDIICMV